MERLGLTRKLKIWSYFENRGNGKNNKVKNYTIKIILILLACILLLEFMTMLIEPTLLALCEVRANSIGVMVSNAGVTKIIENVGYLDLITLDRDDSGKILALRANVIEMNKMSSQISIEIQRMCDELKETSVKIPIGNFTGNSLLAGMGPSITVKLIPAGSVSADFKTEFISTGINQTRHRVFIEIICSIRIVGPFSSRTMQVKNNVNVAETVLIGDVPSTFYNLEGMSDLNGKDSIELWQD